MDMSFWGEVLGVYAMLGLPTIIIIAIGYIATRKERKK